MKKVLLFALVFGSVTIKAQNNNISTLKGKSITVVSNNNTDLDMGMGTMKTDAIITSVMEIVDETKDAYKVVSKLTKAKVSVDGMGQNMSYDSENEGDKGTPIGEALSGKINQTETVMIDKRTFKAINADKSEEKDNDLGSMGIGESKQTVETFFLALPQDMSIGKTWKTNSTEKGITTSTTYTIKSIDNDVATIMVETTSQGTTEREMQGQTMNMTLDSKLKGEMIVNTITNLVSKSTMDGDVNTTLDMMGQQMPMSSKTKTTTTFSF